MTPEREQRERVWRSLWDAHGHSWGRQNWLVADTDVKQRIIAWKREWWAELERAFPEKIKGGIVCR